MTRKAHFLDKSIGGGLETISPSDEIEGVLYQGGSTPSLIQRGWFGVGSDFFGSGCTNAKIISLNRHAESDAD